MMQHNLEVLFKIVKLYLVNFIKTLVLSLCGDKQTQLLMT